MPSSGMQQQCSSKLKGWDKEKPTSGFMTIKRGRSSTTAISNQLLANLWCIIPAYHCHCPHTNDYIFVHRRCLLAFAHCKKRHQPCCLALTPLWWIRWCFQNEMLRPSFNSYYVHGQTGIETVGNFEHCICCNWYCYCYSYYPSPIVSRFDSSQSLSAQSSKRLKSSEFPHHSRFLESGCRSFGTGTVPQCSTVVRILTTDKTDKK